MSDAAKPERLTLHERVRVAAIAACDPRVVSHYEEARSQRPTTAACIERALRKLGLLERVNATRAAAREAKAAG